MSSLGASVGSGAVTADGEIVALESLKNIQDTVEEVFEYCAAKDIQIPENLKHRLEHELAMDTSKTSGTISPSTNRFGSHQEFLSSSRQSSLKKHSVVDHGLIERVQENEKKLKAELPFLDLRLRNVKYAVTNHFDEDPNKKTYDEVKDSGPRRAKQHIETIRSAGPMFRWWRKIKRLATTGKLGDYAQDTTIIDNINLIFEPGKMVLLLGGPGSGKSTILRCIANILPKGKNFHQSGEISLSGISPKLPNINWPSLVGFMDQIDRLHPYLTVFETCEFAWRCRMAGTHRRPWQGEGPEVEETIAKMDEELNLVHTVLEALGLARVKDTFVGDQDKVRGVSGGEKRRVTVAEMLCIGTPVLCCDEISTGLDAATTYDITRLFGLSTRIFNRVTIVSLLQPPPETVANFDELVLVSEGKVMYAGPLKEVIEYFNALGYEIPVRMDVADWLQALPTQEGLRFLKEGGEGDQAQRHLTPEEFSERFYASSRGKEILEKLESPVKATESDKDIIKTIGSTKYANGSLTSMKLLARRELLLWWRDKYQIKAKVVQTIIVGVLVGTLFWRTESNVSKISALFQSMFYACVAQMVSVTRQFPERSIYYKHQDGNFFPTFSYVFGKSVASIPIAITDALCYGTVIYFFVGLAYDEGASIANYFVFLLLLFTISLTTGLFFMIYSASVRVVTIAQAAMSLTAVVFVVFCGFTVQPDVIPDYYIWVYWCNFFAWSLRSLAVNEFQSGKYDNTTISGGDETDGELILTQFGFLTPGGEPFTFEWAWWGFLVTFGWACISMLVTIFCLKNIRFTTGASLVTDQGTDEQEEFDQSTAVAIPFTKVDLTFKHIHYTVTSSITNEELKLLNGIDGVVEAGKMTALMGSSGAGKTTLMDVLALRKSSGEIEGEVRLNGHLQEETSFRRCTGYVEQFDMQSPQLTIRETVDFSANLRLDENDPAVTRDSIAKFVDQTLDMLELTNIQDLQVGSDATGGLSFEQKKRLSIAVELVANPSILFLDEPTSGLDARAAAIVMRGLKRIALSGRAVCATIHQPSIAIFSDFDSLLLLKRGGEVVFFGELGEKSQHLIDYFEKYDGTPKIQPGENPATWMLTTIGAGSSQADGMKPFDYAGNYAQSRLREVALQRIDDIVSGETPDNKITFLTQFATSSRTQGLAVLKRTMTIYYRTPPYNTVRLIIACAVALIFSTVYIPFVPPTNESTLNSIMNSIYISILFLCVNALNTVLALFEFERNMFYRHKAAGMYGARAIVMGFTLSEIPFVFAAATLFTMIFYWILGFRAEAEPFFWFWAFTIFTLCSYTFIGQMLAACLRDSQTAQGFGSLVVMGSSLFGGILLRPSEIPSFWIWMYWLMPGHYFFEGLIVSQYHGDETQIEASPGSAFYQALGCDDPNVPCFGTAQKWVETGFSDWSYHHLPYNMLYLVLLIILTRCVTFYALANLNYRST